jgi:hypothetical protein
MITTLGLAAMMGSAYFAGSAGRTAHPSQETPRVTQQAHSGGAEDAGTVALGETISFVPATAPSAASSMGVGLDMPKRPFTGQRLPPCIQDFEVEVELTPGNKATRSCWLQVVAGAEKCKTKGYEYKGGCYLPSYPPPKLPQTIQP